MKPISNIICTGVLATLTTVAIAAPADISVSPSTPVANSFMYNDLTAKPQPLPMTSTLPKAMGTSPAARFDGPPGFSPGAAGTGKMTPVRLGGTLSAEDMDALSGQVSPMEFGTSNHPFTTSRVDFAGTPANGVSSRYPYRATGKLYFKKPDGLSYVCSASLVKRGVIVTAAHCVTQFGGTGTRWYNSWQFVPAKSGSLAPYGVWNATSATVKTAYYNGTDVCTASSPGVVCQNDIAVLTIVPQNAAYPGTATGWYSYGWNGYGFNPTNLALITQLGYPNSHDAGLQMQRTDSQGFTSSTHVNNTVWGSRQTGGSSGGPELVNFGVVAALSGGVVRGVEPNTNVVVGVTSWGYIDQAVKQQGASAFTNLNIVPLVNQACTATPAACL